MFKTVDSFGIRWLIAKSYRNSGFTGICFFHLWYENIRIYQEILKIIQMIKCVCVNVYTYVICICSKHTDKWSYTPIQAAILLHFSCFLVSRPSELFFLSELLFTTKILQAEWERCASALLKHIGHIMTSWNYCAHPGGNKAGVENAKSVACFPCKPS